MDQEATAPHTVPCGEGTAAFEQVLQQLGLEVPTEHASAAYNDSDSYSDGDDKDDDDDDDDAPVSKTARLVPSNGDGQMGAAPAAGAAVAVVVAGLHIPMR